MLNKLERCTICPWKCEVNRRKNLGVCGCNDKIKIALASLHYFEEPCISGENGSGTIFFTGCNLKCVYCQNHEISTKQVGKEVTIQELANIMLDLQNKKAENINLVTPTMYIYQIIETIKIARKNGLNVPIVYNTNGFEKVESLKLLERLYRCIFTRFQIL